LFGCFYWLEIKYKVFYHDDNAIILNYIETQDSYEQKRMKKYIGNELRYSYEAIAFLSPSSTCLTSLGPMYLCGLNSTLSLK